MVNFENDSKETAKKIFTRIEDEIIQRDLSPTPLNYFLWYHYLKQENLEFCQQMDEMLADPSGMHHRAAKQLFENHFSDNSLAKFENTFKKLLHSIISKLTKWNDSLEKNVGELDLSQIPQDEKSNLSDTLMSVIQRIHQDSQGIISEIANAQHEIERLNHELASAQQAAFTDELTQIHNRKAFHSDVFEVIEQFNEHPMSLLICDIDHFKSINDTYGHLIGDSVLRVFSRLANEICIKNPGSKIYRYGGEEFVIIYQNADLEKARVLAEKIRQQMEKTQLKPKNSPEPLRKITVSIGISQLTESDRLDTWLDRADTALYFAKNSGRNQVILQQSST